jgi:hypothetical protein
MVDVSRASVVESELQSGQFWKFYSDYFKEDARLKKLNI